jgi:hypothetical protein
MRTAMLASLMLVTAAAAGAQGTVRMTSRPVSSLAVEGSSNVHDWHCKATSYDVFAELDGGYARTLAVPQLVKKLEVKVPVRNLKCGSGKMEENLQKALKADQSPTISYVLSNLAVTPGATSAAVTTKATGKLTINGAERVVAMEVVAEKQADGSIRARGELPILMTDFGMKPPTAMMGAMKVGNAVTVKFDLLVAPAGSVAAAGQ